MGNALTIAKKDLRIYTIINYPIKFCRKDGSLVEYKYNIHQSKTGKEIIIVTNEDTIMSATNWNESDIFLFRYYLDSDHASLPIYTDFGDKDNEYFFVAD